MYLPHLRSFQSLLHTSYSCLCQTRTRLTQISRSNATPNNQTKSQLYHTICRNGASPKVVTSRVYAAYTIHTQKHLSRRYHIHFEPTSFFYFKAFLRRVGVIWKLISSSAFRNLQGFHANEEKWEKEDEEEEEEGEVSTANHVITPTKFQGFSPKPLKFLLEGGKGLFRRGDRVGRRGRAPAADFVLTFHHHHIFSYATNSVTKR